jgi:hypothetical protein
MSRKVTLRGHRLTGTPSSEVDRGAELAKRQDATYWCSADHDTTVTFAADVEPPGVWACTTCAGPASLERGTAGPASPVPAFHRTSYEFLMMRRTPEEGEALLADALQRLRGRTS